MRPRFAYICLGLAVALFCLSCGLFFYPRWLDLPKAPLNPSRTPLSLTPTNPAEPVPPPRVLGIIPNFRAVKPHTKVNKASKNRLPAPSDEDLIEQSLAKLKKGNLAYNTPEKMKSGHTAHVTARIASEKVSIQTLKSGMPTDQGTKTEITATPVSTKMKMTLKSADFDITPLSSEEQIVAGDMPTQWEWDIAPKHSGKGRLHLAAIVELNQLSRDFTTVDRDINVQVDPVDAAETFVKNNLIWILGTLGTAFAAGGAWWKRRKKPKVPAWQVP